MLMSDTMNLNVRISGALKNHVSHEIQHGACENVIGYIRDLIRQDNAHPEQTAFEKLKAELQLNLAAPESEYIELSASDITSSQLSSSPSVIPLKYSHHLCCQQQKYAGGWMFKARMRCN